MDSFLDLALVLPHQRRLILVDTVSVILQNVQPCLVGYVPLPQMLLQNQSMLFAVVMITLTQD
jgi:predicted hotdog family 3-hydroxylacyl-ACP dehydratase